MNIILPSSSSHCLQQHVLYQLCKQCGTCTSNKLTHSLFSSLLWLWLSMQGKFNGFFSPPLKHVYCAYFDGLHIYILHYSILYLNHIKSLIFKFLVVITASWLITVDKIIDASLHSFHKCLKLIVGGGGGEVGIHPLAPNIRYTHHTR